MYAYMYIYIYIQACIYIYIYIHTYIHTYTYIRICMHIYTYIHTYTHVHTWNELEGGAWKGLCVAPATFCDNCSKLIDATGVTLYALIHLFFLSAFPTLPKAMNRVTCLTPSDDPPTGGLMYGGCVYVCMYVWLFAVYIYMYIYIYHNIYIYIYSRLWIESRASRPRMTPPRVDWCMEAACMYVYMYVCMYDFLLYT
jgi:hypothetical protein